MDIFANFFSQQLPSFSLLVIFIWSIFWKGLALWRAVGEKQKYWFMAMLILNTVGILEIIYLFKFARRRLTFKEVKSWVLRR